MVIHCMGTLSGCCFLYMMSNHDTAGAFQRLWLIRSRRPRPDEGTALPRTRLCRSNFVEKRTRRSRRYAHGIWFGSGSAGSSVYYTMVLSSTIWRRRRGATVWFHLMGAKWPHSWWPGLPELTRASFSVYANDARRGGTRHTRLVTGVFNRLTHSIYPTDLLSRPDGRVWSRFTLVVVFARRDTDLSGWSKHSWPEVMIRRRVLEFRIHRVVPQRKWSAVRTDLSSGHLLRTHGLFSDDSSPRLGWV